MAEQAASLRALRQHAMQRSPFYRELHRSLAGAPLQQLPVVTKHMLMTRFDEVLTERRMRLAALQAYLTSNADKPFEGSHGVATTSGSSGRNAIIPSGRREWSSIVGSYARASDWSGGALHVWRRRKMAVVSSTTPWHQSSRMARSVRSPFAVSVRYDADTPLQSLVEALNEQRPDILIGYVSALTVLALEQLEGRLRIRPRSINASSEVFGAEARTLVTRAFGVQPYEVYAATETGGIAAECSRHEGLHVFEDLVIVEPVDDACQPVPIGEVGARTLVTVLNSRTLPLIRYELTHRVQLSRPRARWWRPAPGCVPALQDRRDSRSRSERSSRSERARRSLWRQACRRPRLERVVHIANGQPIASDRFAIGLNSGMKLTVTRRSE